MTLPAPAISTRTEPGGSPPSESCLHGMFEAQAARTPDAVAVIFDGDTLTYDALNRRANQLARRLRALGVGPGSLVGVCLERSQEMVIGLLGVLKAGGAYVPLDPEYPAERLAFMLADAQTHVLLTQEHLLPRLPKYDAVTLCLDSGWNRIAGEAESDLPYGARSDDLAYVIYTSGSTGTPKGVEIRHRGVCSNLQWRQETFPLAAQDRLLQTYSFSFDPSVWAFFWPLTTGAAAVLPRPGEHGDPARLVELIQRQQISILGVGPSLLRVLLGHPDIGYCHGLRHVFSGGEALASDLVERFFAALPAADLHNVYGPTEATIDATWWTCRRGETQPFVPIGHSLPRTRAYLLGEDALPVADGDAGELHIAGVGLARGYLRRPELTAEKFVPNSFCRDAEERTLFPTLYRTGDLCRQRPDGAIEYLGRMDQQVKVRGFRIELGEIEAVLSRHPDVCDVAVRTQEDAGGSQRLAAYIVPTSHSLSRQSFKKYVADTLPAYMVPGAFVILDSLPLTPNGKLDRNALPPPEASDWERDGERVPPRTLLEEQLVTVFEDLLGVGPLGVRDDFFAWGGHSLLAARLVNEAERLTGRRLALTDLADGATVEHLAARLERSEDNAPELPLLQRWSHGPGRPFFFLHGSFTGGLYCADLARHLGPDQAFYGLMPHGADGGPIPPTVEAMAAEYVATIRAVQPAGPYLLGGFCNGGLVAYEVARQLQAAGQEVRRLVLIEVILAPTLAKLRLHAAACRLGLSTGLQSRLSRALQTGSVPVLLSLRAAKRAWRRLAPALGCDPGYDWAAGVPLSYQKTSVFYNLRPYHGPITVVSAAESAGPPEGGWRNLAPHAVFDTIPGSHFDSTQEHLPLLAERLRTHLAFNAAGGKSNV